MEDELGTESIEATETPAAEAPPEAPASWAPPEDEWKQVQQFISQSAPLLGQLGEVLNQPNDPGEQEIDFDPFDPDSVQKFIDARAESIASKQMEPFRGLLGMLSVREGEALAKAELDKVGAEIGEFDKDTAFLIASGLIDQGGDPGQALRQAASHAKDFESRVRQDERAKVEAEIKGLGQAPNETGIGSTTAETPQQVPTGPGRYEEAIQRALANRRAGMPVG